MARVHARRFLRWCLRFLLLSTSLLLWGQAPSGPGAVVGSWEVRQANGSFRMVLNADGSGTLNNSPIHWEVKGKILMISEGSATNMYNLAVTATTLTISGGNLQAPVTFQKISSGGGAKGGLAGLGSMGAAAGKAPPAIAGTWEATTAPGAVRMVFNADGSGNFNGDEGTWTYRGSALNLSAGGSSYTYKAALNGNKLILSGANLQQPLTLERSGGESPAPEAPASESETATSDETGGGTEGASKLPANLLGKWQGKAGAIEIRSDGTFVFPTGQGVPCTAEGDTLNLQGTDGVLRFRFNVSGSTLSLTAPTGQTLSYTRIGEGAPATRSASPAKRPSGGALSTTAGRTTGDTGNGASGNRYSKDNWGLHFVIPEAWKIGDRGALLLAGSDTEPGLMIIRYVPRAGLGELQQLYAQGIQEQDFQAAPSAPAGEFRAGSLRGIAGEMAGFSQQAGGRVRVRAIGIPSPYGGSAIVLGVTTENNYPNLKRRTDQLAATISFTERKVPPVVDFLAGHYEFYYGSSTYNSSYSRTSSLALCDDGSFSKGGEMSGSFDAGSVGTQRGGGGRWTAQGDQYQGVVIFTYPNGQQSQLPYVVSQDPKDLSGYGPAVSFGSDKYQKTGGGSCM